jgi:hypothetical protein
VYKRQVQCLELENKNLQTRLNQLEKMFTMIENYDEKFLKSSKNKTIEKTKLQTIYHNSKKIYSVYQYSKIIVYAMCFLFGNKVLSNPWILKTIFAMVFHKLK